MTKKTTTKKSFDLYYRAPCPAIDQILLIKKLSQVEAINLYNNLKATVASLPAEGSILAYVKILIKELLYDPDVIKPYIDDDTEILVLKEVYECIVDIYISFRIDVICADLNNLQPLNPFEPVDVKNFDYLKPTDGKPKNKPADPQSSNPMDQVADILRALDPTPQPRRTKKPAFSLTLKDLEIMEASLKKSIIGQDKAIETLINRLKLISVGFDKRGAFFFIGRTGVGKTELAKLFGKKYCNNFAKINCGEFTNGHEVAKLIGAPPGYVGSNQKSFFLEKSEISNRWVFLFDEIEKAHEKLFNLLLSLLDDGTITDSNGNTLDFTNSIFIFTSNQGISEIKDSSLAFSAKGHSADGAKETLKESLNRLFTPEFRNRIDEFIYFNDLDKDNVVKIAKLHLKQYPVAQTDELIEYIVANAYSKEYGVRELKRFIKSNIALLVAEAILARKVPNDGTRNYTFKVQDNKLELINIAPVPQVSSIKL